MLQGKDEKLSSQAFQDNAKMRSFFCLAFSFALLFPCLLLAEPVTDSEEPYNIYAERILYDPSLEAYKAFGDVRIERTGMVFTGAEAMYHPKDGTLAGSGDFVLKQGRDTLMGERILYNLNQETGSVENGFLIMADSDFRIRGSAISKTGEDRYTAENVKITTCGGDCPDWSLTASRLSVKHGGYGTLHHGVFRIKDVPVLYTPWLLFPAKTKRQSGLLFPEMDYSDRFGFEYLQPFYFVINDSSDATFYYHFRSQENDRIGVEYRKVWSENSKLLFRAEGLDESEKPEKPKDPDYRGDRYWVRMKGNFDLPANIKGFADIDVVSDKEYFHDFKSGSLGFNTTNLLFQNEFGRDLDPKTEATRTNRFLASKVEDIWSLEAQLLWEDNVHKRRNDLYDNTVQRLPEVRFSTRRQNLQAIPFLYHNFKAETFYFHREDGERGARLDLFPRLYLPFHLGPLSIEPSVGVRQTLWYSDDPEDPESSGYDRESRTMFDARLDLFTEVHRVFDLDFASVDKIRHSIQPRVTFGYISDEDQEDLPYFDNYDRIEKQRLITYSLTQTLMARLPAKKIAGTGQALNQYRELLRFKVSQSYDLDKTSAKDEKAFSDIKSELSTEIFPGFKLYGDIIWSTEEEEWTSYSAGARISRGKHRLYAEYRYSKEISSTLRLSGFIELTERFGVFWDFDRNLRNNDTIEEDYGIRYNGGCWQVDLVYSTDEDDNKVALYWTLKGIGTIQHSATVY